MKRAAVENAVTYARPSWKPTLEAALPFTAKALLSAYRLARGGHPEFYVEIPLRPPSVNNIYRRWHSKKTNKTGFSLQESVVEFHKMAAASCWGKSYKPRGTIGAVIAVESPDWITLEHKVKDRDIDNGIKIVLDSLQDSLTVRDSLVWEVYGCKILSRREATHVWLFDLGEVISAIGPITKGALL